MSQLSALTSVGTKVEISPEISRATGSICLQDRRDVVPPPVCELVHGPQGCTRQRKAGAASGCSPVPAMGNCYCAYIMWTEKGQVPAHCSATAVIITHGITPSFLRSYLLLSGLLNYCEVLPTIPAHENLIRFNKFKCKLLHLG